MSVPVNISLLTPHWLQHTCHRDACVKRSIRGRLAQTHSANSVLYWLVRPPCSAYHTKINTQTHATQRGCVLCRITFTSTAVYSMCNHNQNELYWPGMFTHTRKDPRLFLCTQKAYFSQILFTNLSKSVLVSEIIHPPHRCGISRCWLDSMIIAQVCLRLATIKGHYKMCNVLSHSTMPQMTQVLRERAIGMLTAGMSTRSVACELNFHFSTISRLQRRFREFGSTSNRPHNRRHMSNHTSPGPPYPASSAPCSHMASFLHDRALFGIMQGFWKYS